MLGNYLILQTLMLDLSRSLEDRQDSANLQIAVLSFINVIINYKAGEVSIILYSCVPIDCQSFGSCMPAGKSRVSYASATRVLAAGNPTDYQPTQSTKHSPAQ